MPLATTPSLSAAVGGGLGREHLCRHTLLKINPLPRFSFEQSKTAPRERRRVRCAAGSSKPLKPNENALKEAAERFAKGLELGIEEDELVAKELGKKDSSELTDLQAAYKDKIAAKLAAQVAEEKRKRELKSAVFLQGQGAYGSGEYWAAVSLFEQALEAEGRFTQLGGEIQMWLALAYQACGREDDCIALYKSVEKEHPLPKIRRQAEHLRYIMEAPKLVIGEDERVKVPLIQFDDENYKRSKRVQRPKAPKAQTIEPRRNETPIDKFLREYQGPAWVQNKYVWVASAVIGSGLAVYSVVYLK